MHGFSRIYENHSSYVPEDELIASFYLMKSVSILFVGQFTEFLSLDKPTVIVIFSRFERGVDLVFNRVLKNTKVSHPLCTRC